MAGKWGIGQHTWLDVSALRPGWRHFLVESRDVATGDALLRGHLGTHETFMPHGDDAIGTGRCWVEKS